MRKEADAAGARGFTESQIVFILEEEDNGVPVEERFQSSRELKTAPILE
jgi:hypothetical protein